MPVIVPARVVVSGRVTTTGSPTFAMGSCCGESCTVTACWSLVACSTGAAGSIRSPGPNA
jgi:hypothetical protein